MGGGGWVLDHHGTANMQTYIIQYVVASGENQGYRMPLCDYGQRCRWFVITKSMSEAAALPSLRKLKDAIGGVH